MPVTFIENRGQLDKQVRYYTQGSRHGLYFTSEGVVLAFLKGDDPTLAADADIQDISTALAAAAAEQQGASIALRFVGGNPPVVPEALGRVPGAVNYLRGSDPAGWQTQLPAYTQVVYRERWPGVDVLLRGQGQQLKYEFRVRPGARPADIRLAYDGATSLALDGAGGLRIGTALGALRDAPPLTYQEVAGARMAVESHYVLHGDGAYGFAVGAGYDPRRELIIDPGVVYSTFLGGFDIDDGLGIAVDAAGSAYVTGETGSLNFPTTSGAFDTSLGGDAFVTKLNPAGSALVYSTALGGAGPEGASAVAVDSASNAWVTGGTSSGDFPTTADGFDRSFNGTADAFAAELNPAGSALLYSTYLGGTNSENGNDLALDPGGNAYITGHTYSLDFPTTQGAFDTVFNGDTSIFWGDGFVTKIAIGRTTSAPPSTPAIPSAPVLVAPSNGDNPPQPITFQWNIASGAASYTIQIDDSNAFSAPLVREQQNITGVMYATSGLATTQHFWRVRGVNTAGVAGAWSAVRSFTPQAAPPPATLSTFSTNPSTVVGGNDSTGTVVLSVGAPEGGAVVALSSSNPAVASVPASVTIPSNDFAGTFVFSTSPVPANTLVTLTAAYNGSTRTATVTVTPPASTPSPTPTPPPATWQSLALNPASVTGGSNAQGTITLSSAAPQGSAVVALSSSNPAVASVPASVTVGASATSAGFAVTTASVSAPSTVTISATYGGTTRTATLTVAPPPAGPLPAPTLQSPASDARFAPGTSITFNWSDVVGAASYTIQVDNSDSFAAPLTVNQNVSASQFTTGTLPTTRMWWRVRANDAAGTPGAWSSVRRFEIKQ